MTISLLVAVSFHSLVYHRFHVFVTNLNEAARIKLILEWDELNAFGYYLQSVRFHRKGIHDTIEAYEYAAAAEWWNESLVEKEQDVERLKQDEQEAEQEAESFEHKSTMDGRSSFRNERASVGARIAGMDLARLAQTELERSERIMNQTSDTQALQELAQARTALAEAEKAKNSTHLDKGICKWAGAICSVIRSKRNQTEPSKAVIQANREIQASLQTIHEIENDRALAIELHRNASLHANLSMTILTDALAFQNQSNIDLHHAEEERTIAQEKWAEAEQDREEIQEEESEILLIEQEIQNDTKRSEYYFQRVNVDRYRENYALERMNRDLDYYQKRRIQWEAKLHEADHHISRAGWEALVGSVAGLCLLVLVTTNMVGTFRYQRPFRWILREPPYFARDAWYLVCHVAIFVLAMAYMGELLINFSHQTIASRLGITIALSLCAMVLQLVLLHLFPAVLLGELEANSMRLWIKQTIAHNGTIIGLVSAIEILLCWCWMGTWAFEKVHKLNNFLVWLVVVSLSVGHGFFLRKHEQANSFSVQSPSTNISSKVPGSIVMNDERDSLLAPSFSERGFQSPSTSSGSQPSMYTIPVGSSDSYNHEDDHGSLSRYLGHLSFNARLASDLEKVRLLLEIYLASLGLWIMRKDLELIRKLSPLASLVWGQAPLWIVNICLFLVLASLIVSVANIKKRGHT